MKHPQPSELLHPTDTFIRRHIGPRDGEIAAMLKTLGVASLEALVDETLPAGIRLKGALTLPGLPADRPLGEEELLSRLRGMAKRNEVLKSYLGMGYHDCIVPGVILRNVLENPGWYTQYTPYQAEIAQGRLEALLNFQTLVADLTGLPMANASLLDEGTAAAEAMAMCRALDKRGRKTFFVARDCHPQTLAVVQTRAGALGWNVVSGDASAIDWSDVFGVLVQYPATDGAVVDYAPLTKTAHEHGALVVVAADLLALTLLRAPGEFGADIAVGTAQRFGVPLGFGGPHAAYLATSDQYKRQLPGRVIGVSKDARGKHAYRMAMQTREQHIRREKATSNICTAQALLAIMASMYAVYHGPEGLTRIASRVRLLTLALARGLRAAGLKIPDAPVFDTLRVELGSQASAVVVAAARAKKMNLRELGSHAVGISLDETTTLEDVDALLGVLGAMGASAAALCEGLDLTYPAPHARTSAFLTHPVFNSYHSEHEMLRYINRLRARDLSLTHSMIALGSCTMKLNATSEMKPVTWAEFGSLHPFAPAEQTRGYQELFSTLQAWLAEITGFSAVSL
ncbi:MAG TPA: glycine dehydrogenase (aminomethyl-transferring), partial [Myxococcota bacterium]|nr:glycine dehydrogenase (aminomethyl-transferring) [Myxococcota bacterium]